jgi:hypothetical protein
MKKLLLAAALAFTLIPAVHADPSVSIDQALKIANKYLKENDRDGVFIKSLSLDPTSLARNQYVWAAMWSAPVMLDNTKRETGVEIAMDGTVARYIEKVGSSTATPGSVGVPASRAELSNHRTRSTRPSILDLKH